MQVTDLKYELQVLIVEYQVQSTTAAAVRGAVYRAAVRYSNSNTRLKGHMANCCVRLRILLTVRHAFMGAFSHCFHMEDVSVEIALCLYSRVFSNTWVPTYVPGAWDGSGYRVRFQMQETALHCEDEGRYRCT